MKGRLNILYAHGFASTGGGEKATYLREFYRGKNVNIISPTLSPDPAKAIYSLGSILADIPNDEWIVGIGNSLGGFYMLCVNMDWAIPVFAINPVIDPSTLRKHIGANKNLVTGEIFDFREEYVKTLEDKTQDLFKPYQVNINVLLSKDDDLIPYQQTLDLLPPTYNVQVYESGGHRFSIFPQVLKETIAPAIQGYVDRGEATYTLCL